MARLFDAEQCFGKKPGVTPLLEIPVLTDEEKLRLVEDMDRSVTPVTGLLRYPTFENWQSSGGLFGRNNFWMHFSSGNLMLPFHEMRYMQRFEHLYPELYDELEIVTDAWVGNLDKGLPSITQEQEHLYWDAYEKMSGLVSADDPLVANGEDLPPGEAYPALLFG